MSADPILYCLETITDYSQFERLASDLMAGTEFPGIEPLGGTGDGGRDALHIHRDNGITTVFAYSVRTDWDSKLRADCKRIAETCSHVDVVVFVSTQVIGAQPKDKLRLEIGQSYGWSIEFYDVERIRVLLIGPLKGLVSKHPSIFVSPWFERRGGELITNEQRDLILIDHITADHAFASWLFKKLCAAGYLVWCYGLAPLAGENADASVRTLMQRRAARYLPVLSELSVVEPNLRGRMSIAANEENRTLPCWVTDLSDFRFDTRLESISPARFDLSWPTALAIVESQLESGGITKPLDVETGRRIALSAYTRESLLIGKSERVYSNVFAVKVPVAVYAYELENEDGVIDKVLAETWAHVRRGSFLFSFLEAPDGLPLKSGRPHQYAWRHYEKHLGVRSQDLIKMLVKRSLFVACYRAGFKWCEDRHTFYLEEEERRRHGYQHVDEVYTHVSFTGERSWGIGEGRSKYRYQLGPVFRVSFDDEGVVWVMLRLYVRVTDQDGKPLDVRLIPSRRKRVTRNWWNRQWLQRTVGMMQFIAGEGADITGEIVIGSGKQAVTVNVSPLSWECPVSIDVEALDRVGHFQAELAAVRETEDTLGPDPEAESDA